MRLAELQQALRTADPAAVLVPPRVLERLIQAQHQLSGLFEQVPHRKCYVVDRPTLYRHVEQDELDLEPDRLLPSPVILLARPSPNTLATEESETILLAFWRRLFHANIERVLRQQVSEGRLTPALVRERIDEIGPSTFAEIRMVLDQEKCLLPSGAGADETGRVHRVRRRVPGAALFRRQPAADLLSRPGRPRAGSMPCWRAT